MPRATDTQPASTWAESPLQLDKVCIAIQAETPEEMSRRAETACADSTFLEFRLDSLAQPGEALRMVRQFLGDHPKTTAVATCRRKQNGGNFGGSLADELAVLVAAARAGCRVVDLEVESAEDTSGAELNEFRAHLQAAGAALLVSFHDFVRTGDLEQAARRIEAFAPDFVKVVSTAQSLADNLAVLRLIESRAQSRRVVGIAMGEQGIVSRVLAPRAGAAFTFAASGNGEETAPGQVTARTLRELYNLEALDRATRIYGVAGDPIAHSMSPRMHNAAFRHEQVNAAMLPLRARLAGDLMKLVRELPLNGAAVTMPLKREVLPYLASMDALTERIGACNTLRMEPDGKLSGFNTDVAGVVRPLERRMALKGARIAVLGAGGAARAAVFGLVDRGAEVFVVNRTHEKAAALAAEAKAAAMPHEQLAQQRFDVLLNTTPCGMTGSAQALPIAEDELNAGLVFDMVYNPRETPLLKLAASRGVATIGGVEMFVQQGVRQFEIWTGEPAPEAEMQRVVEAALGNGS